MNQQQTMQLIVSLIQLATATTPLVAAEILKLRAMLEQSPDIKANLQKLFDDTVAADQDTIDTANAWLTAHGFSPVQ